MIKKLITPYLLLFCLLLNTTATVFATQEEKIQTTREQITQFLNNHKKKLSDLLEWQESAFYIINLA